MMAFTFDPTIDQGKVRLLIGDTTDGTYGTDYDFTDADIDAFLEQNGDSVWLAASDACRSLAMKAASGSISLSIAGAISIDKKSIVQNYLELSKRYQDRAVTGPDMVVEYVDSFAISRNVLGVDTTEYISD